ncbi:MAG: beta galactosidase jelly roll domain-containing protein [Lentisphaeria bacterium]|nr:beta galactosidase jelly roll domain-containing protein [Lentisphaeria bacterium]
MLSLGCAVGPRSEVAEGEPSGGDLRFAPLFQSGAVLQRDMPLPVWGRATPGSRVRCRLGSDAAVTVTDGFGNFRLWLPPQSAGTGKELILEELASGRRVVSENIAVGEVYLLAGQSNMELPLHRALDGDAAKNYPADPDLRMFRVPVTKLPGPQPEARGKWQTATAESAANFSAVGYHFGRTLRRELGVPVGLIGAYLGGMGAESFVSREALLANPDFAADAAKYDVLEFSEDHYRDLPPDRAVPDGGDAAIFARLDELFPGEPAKLGEAQKWHTPEFDDAAWQEMELPDSWTLAGYNHAGVFWFRKYVDIPAEWAGHDLTLGIGAADKCDETFFNGEKVGQTGHFRRFEHWNTPRTYRIPGRLVKPGSNLIAVRVASAASISADGGLIGPAAEMKLECGSAAIPLTGKWKLRMEHNFGTAGMEFMRLLGPGAPASLHMLYDNMIHPLIPAALRGVVWYQGEANAICMADSYERLLLTLIDDWKFRWGRRDMNFIIIQLPGFQTARDYDAHSQWAKLREAQRRAALTSGSDLVVTLEYGEADDIHPRNKKPVGERAGAIAARRIAGKPACQAPAPVKCRREDRTLIVEFDAPVVLLRGEKPAALVIAGADGEFHPAAAEIAAGGREIRLTSAAVPAPVRVRYAWSNNPAAANLGGSNDLPVSPFALAQ